jgi:hypothetical protein
MALTTDKKLYVALGVAVLLGGGLFLQRQGAKKEAQGHSASAKQASLPKLSFTKEAAEKVTRLVVEKPGKDGAPVQKVTLVKDGENWALSEPLKARAAAENIKSVLENLPEIEFKERIAAGVDAYATYDLTEDKATKVTVFEGDKQVLQLYFGKGGSRGQTARIAGTDGVFAVKGYSAYLYGRDVKGWRDRKIASVDTAKVKSMKVVNENGTFEFTRDAGAGDDAKWKAKHKAAKAPAAKELEKFDNAKAADLLRAFKDLTAVDFGDDKKPADVGLDKPVATVTFTLEDATSSVVEFGSTAEGSNRWARKVGNEQLFSVSSWTAGWATAEAKRFQEAKPTDAKPAGDGPGGSPMPMQMQMPQMDEP